MKKILAMLLALTLIFAFAACKKNNSEPTDPTGTTGQTSATGATQSTDGTEATQGSEPATQPTGNSTPTTPTIQGGEETPTDPVDEGDPLPEAPGICSHNWGSATCTTGRICSMCGAEENRADALGHSWKDATCTAPKTCRRCGATEGKAADHEFSGGVCTDCGEPDPNPPKTEEDELPVL